MAAFSVGIVGAGFISDVHITSLKMVPDVEVAAIADPDTKRARKLARAHGVKTVYPGYKEMLKESAVDMVWVCVPNFLHAPIGLDVLKAGRHVVIEKPMALTLADCDRLIDESAKRKLVIGYGEELCYVPKFVHAKQAADDGAIGDVFYVKQFEKHSGAYSPWFFKAKTAGGGILMDMGCHAIEACRWALDKPRAVAVWAHVARYGAHLDQWKPEVEDHVVMHIEFETGATALVESAWTMKGGMVSELEFNGTDGVIKANLLQDGMGLKIYSEKGYGPREDRKDRTGWHHPDWQWHWNNGYPQEDADFVRAAMSGTQPVETAEDGRAVLEIMLAGYQSAATGTRVSLPFTPPRGIKSPVDIWRKAGGGKKLDLKPARKGKK